MNWYRFFFPVKELKPEEAKLYIENNPKGTYSLIDVRQPFEHSQEKIEESVLIPLFEIFKKTQQMNRTKPVLVYCRSGHRSSIACRILNAKGFETVFNISGGILEWKENKNI